MILSKMKKDLTIVALTFILIIVFGINVKQWCEIKHLQKDLNDTINVVYWLNDKLDNSYLMIDSLNKEITNNWKEIEEYKELKNLKKDLARHTN